MLASAIFVRLELVNTLFFVLLIAISAGVMAALQAQLNALTSARIGLIEGALLPHLIGALIALMLMVLFKAQGLRQLLSLPWYGYLPGAFGLALVMGLSFATPRLGVTSTIVVFVVSQLIVGALIGHFGWLGSPIKPLELGRIAGIALLLLGAYLVVRPT
jgi:bacterial/archaeal transporter family-2 protein